MDSVIIVTPISMVLIISMVLCGVVGGIVNLVKEEVVTIKIVVYNVFLGIIAAFVVPLFLNLISSSIISKILESNSIFQTDFFVFVGFCSLFSLYSKRFLDKMFDKVSEEITKLQKNSDKTNKEIKEIIEDKLTEKEDEKPIPQVKLLKVNGIKIKTKNKTSNETLDLILRKLFYSNFKYRTFNGLLKDTELSNDDLINGLEELINLKLVITRKNSIQKYVYSITNDGKALFE